MSDLVERLREAAHALANLEWYADSAVCDQAANEITRLRESERATRKQWCGRDFDHLPLCEAVGAAAQARESALEARIAPLERVVAAADDMRTWLEVNTIPAMLAREAYDAVRKGEG